MNKYILLTLSLLASFNGFASNDSKSLAGNIYMVTIHTNNFLEMRAFYHDVMQMEIISESGEFIEFASNGLRLSLASYKSLDFLSSNSLKGIRKGSGLGVGFKYKTKEDVDNNYNEMIQRGATPVSAPSAQPWGEYTAFFADPDGNVHELVSDIKNLKQ